MHQRQGWLRTLAAGLLLLSAAATAWGQISGAYRIYRMNGTYVEGNVQEQPDGSFRVTLEHGIVVIVLRNEVKSVVPMKDLIGPSDRPSPEPAAAQPAPGRRAITPAEIDAIIGDTKAEQVGEGSTTNLDLDAALSADEDSIQEMMSQAGAGAKRLDKYHFVMVYTSSDEAARELAARLEAVYRWNVRFLDMLKVPARRPEHKLEIFYFGTYQEYAAYSTNIGTDVAGGVLGYYRPDINRSHFFDLMTAPGLAHALERLKDRGVPYPQRQYYTNVIKRWVDFMNTSVIQHEAGHHMHFNMGVFPRNGFEAGSSVPLWLVEGTTMMFEFPPTAAGASLGTLNHYRLDQLRKVYGPHPLDAAQWKLFIIDNGTWQGAASYPLGWAMVYYLWKEHRTGYARYLQTVFGRDETTRMTNTDREREFEDIFGRVDEKWIARFYKFLDGLQVRPSVLPPDLSGP